MANVYDTGDAIDITTSTAFQDSGGTAFDPTTVTFKVKAPSGTTTSYVYGTDSEVVKNDTGDYTCTIDVDVPGEWYYRVEGVNATANRGADEGYFVVRASRV